MSLTTTTTPTTTNNKMFKIAGCDYVGSPPKEFVGNIERMKFHIYDFANHNNNRSETPYFRTGTIEAHGHLWGLRIHPTFNPNPSSRHNNNNNEQQPYVRIYLEYAGSNPESNPVVAKASIRTNKTKKQEQTIDADHYSKETRGRDWDYGYVSYKRNDILKNKRCNKKDAGTLIVTVDIEVATEQRSSDVWYPTLNPKNNTIGAALYRSKKASDVSFLIGLSKTEYCGHKCILAVRSPALYDLILTVEESSLSSHDDDNNYNTPAATIMLPDIDEAVFEAILEYIYMNKIPEFNEESNMNVVDKKEEEEIRTKSILVTADRFDCTVLKMYMESVLVDKFLTPSNTATLLLFADSYSCPLLKEATFDIFASHSQEIMNMNSNKNDDGGGWIKLQESSKLLTELLMYTNSKVAGGRMKKYAFSSTTVESDNGTADFLVDDTVDDLDVTSLRERLQKVDLDVDGSRSMLVKRWKNYLQYCYNCVGADADVGMN